MAEAWDELRESDGRLRAVWQRFFAGAGFAQGANAAAQAERLRNAIAQHIRADGVTHTIAEAGVEGALGAAHRAAPRPWSLEALPHLIEPADWARIEAGAVQRARLLARMLADVYGPQRLLHDALLPPTLLFRHRGYLRPLHGVRPVGGMHLHIVALDMARGPDGHWWVVSQRTQSPSGLGYVLQNRLIVSRLFPEPLRDLHVQHITGAYRRLIDMVSQQAGAVAQRLGDGAPARVALLTPGPYSETYFEHAYLARHLGLPLVEGADLTVRGECLFLRTVEGLQPLHALLRRLDDDFCDPLELRSDSALGVPGLLQVLRAGNLVLANALGSGFLESSAVQGFLPAISRALLGEPLLLPSLATWWCGEAAAWAAVRGNLTGRVLRPAFGGSGGGARLIAADEAAALQSRIDDDPDAFTVQGHLALSRAALLQADGRLAPRPAMLRVYAIADDGDHWHVLPGGLTRVATRAPLSVSMAQGGTSLDTWVLSAPRPAEAGHPPKGSMTVAEPHLLESDGAVAGWSVLAPRLTVDNLAARRPPVASRSAENQFWLGRYTERAEQSVRLARSALALIDGDEDVPDALLEPLSQLATLYGLVPEGTPSAQRSLAVFARSLLATLRQRDQGVGFNLAALARSASALHDRLPPEQWSLLRRVSEDFHAHFEADVFGSPVPGSAQALPALQRLAQQLAAVTGAQMDRMTRDHGWRLLSVGRLIERLAGMGASLAALVDAVGPRGGSSAATELLLDLFDSSITFRARYQHHEDLLALADLLLLDDTNPRAFAGALRRLRTELGKLPSPLGLREMLPATGAGVALESLRGADDVALRAVLARTAESLQHAAAALSDAVGQRYFAHAEGGDQVQRV